MEKDMIRTLHAIFFVTLMTVSALLITPLTAQSNQQTRVLYLKGKAVGETRKIPVVEATGTNEGNCFDVDMIDPQNQVSLGSATRCFTDMQTMRDGMAVTGTTFLKFRDGTIVARNRATIQPILVKPTEMTHIISGVPSPLATNLLVSHNTNRYQDTAGSLRFGGIINLGEFQEKNTIVFDEVAIVTLADAQEPIKQVQRLLKEAGFYRGTLDGILGQNTKEALFKYQAKHGLPKTGELDEATRKALSLME
jgi:hypothetical protein